MTLPRCGSLWRDGRALQDKLLPRCPNSGVNAPEGSAKLSYGRGFFFSLLARRQATWSLAEPLAASCFLVSSSLGGAPSMIVAKMVPQINKLPKSTAARLAGEPRYGSVDDVDDFRPHGCCPRLWLWTWWWCSIPLQAVIVDFLFNCGYWCSTLKYPQGTRPIRRPRQLLHTYSHVVHLAFKTAVWDLPGKAPHQGRMFCHPTNRQILGKDLWDPCCASIARGGAQLGTETAISSYNSLIAMI